MQRRRGWLIAMSLGLVCLAAGVQAKEPESDASRRSIHDRPPRKVIVGTTMTRWYSDYPGLEGRLKQIGELLHEMARESQTKYGRSPDLVLFTEYALTAGKVGSAIEIAVPVDETIVKPLGELAKRYRCNLVVGGVFQDGTPAATCSNAAIVINREGRLAGRMTRCIRCLMR